MSSGIWGLGITSQGKQESYTQKPQENEQGLSALEPVFQSKCEATRSAVLLQFDLEGDVLVEGTLPGTGALGKCASIVCVVSTALAQKFFPSRAV